MYNLHAALCFWGKEEEKKTKKKIARITTLLRSAETVSCTARGLWCIIPYSFAFSRVSTNLTGLRRGLTRCRIHRVHVHVRVRYRDTICSGSSQGSSFQITNINIAESIRPRFPHGALGALGTPRSWVQQDNVKPHPSPEDLKYLRVLKRGTAPFHSNASPEQPGSKYIRAGFLQGNHWRKMESLVIRNRTSTLHKYARMKLYYYSYQKRFIVKFFVQGVRIRSYQSVKSMKSIINQKMYNEPKTISRTKLLAESEPKIQIPSPSLPAQHRIQTAFTEETALHAHRVPLFGQINLITMEIEIEIIRAV